LKKFGNIFEFGEKGVI